MDIESYQQVKEALKTFLATAKNPLLVVLGPTASGKTKLAVQLAKTFHGEVINADSRQVYEEMEIGNELTKPEEMEGIPHHLLSFVPLSHPLSVAEYKEAAEEKISEIASRAKLPILCGGTVMWIEAIVENYQIPAGKGDMKLRKQLDQQDVDALLKALKEVDPESADQLEEAKNKRYIIRALEIYHLTGKTKTELAKKGQRKVDVFKVASFWERETLYERINERTEYQVDHGMIPEVQHLVDQYAHGNPYELLALNWPSITSIGCKEVIPYLAGDVSKEEMVAQLQQNNRNYAKRQLTWLRKDPEIHWIDGEAT